MQIAIFAIALFTSATLLFWAQPLIAKALLPAYGGAPEVWGGCVLFFQSVIMVSYGYVFFLDKRFSLRRQTIIHITLLVLTVPLAFPLNFETRPPEWLYDRTPVLSALFELVLALGIPAFVLATSSPLLQKWAAYLYPGFGQSIYSFYAISNAGSLAATVGYPFLMEPALNLNRQGSLWSALYLIYILLALACAWLVWRAGRVATSKNRDTQPSTDGLAAEVHSPDASRWKWVLLSAVPASLLLGVTNHITANITATPLLWLLPLTLYLLSFILAFSARSHHLNVDLGPLAQGATVLLTLTFVAEATEPAWALALLHLAAFFILATAINFRLAAAKPTVDRLPEYYFMIAIGGLIGGAFNTLLAPHIFDRFWEYPLMICIACVACQQIEGGKTELRRGILDAVCALLIGALTLALARYASFLNLGDLARVALAFGLPLFLVNRFFIHRPLRFALTIGAIIIAGALASEALNRTLHSERNFFGALRVTSTPDRSMNILFHGNTIHGKQFTDAARKCNPISYFHPDGPFGDLIKAFEASQTAKTVGVVGLGVGVMASYARPGHNWTFYELNPEILKIAANKDYFTYLSDCARQEIRIVSGDARLKLREAPDASFGLIVLDAFTSDAIPTHLLTTEAIELYLSKLSANGLLAFHISNRSIDLRPVLAAAAKAKDAECLWRQDPDDHPSLGKDASEWIALVRRSNTLEGIAPLLSWERVSPDVNVAMWTDSHASLMKLIRWR